MSQLFGFQINRKEGQKGQSPVPPSAEDPVAVAACSAQADDALAGLEECRLAVEQVVLPHGQPVELLPRSERVRLMQAELADRYRLRTAVFGRGVEQRLRLFPA